MVFEREIYVIKLFHLLKSRDKVGPTLEKGPDLNDDLRVLGN